MAKQNQHGFTLIELILFLALSGLFLLIALNGVRGRTASIQFTDSMRSLQSYLEQQKSSILTGVNVGGSGAGTSGDKIILGKAFVFKIGEKQVSTYTVFANRLTQAQYDSLLASDKNNVKSLIYKVGAYIDKNTLETYDLAWGLEFLEGFNPKGGGDQGPTRAFAMVRDPFGQNLIPYSFIGNKPDDPNFFKNNAFEPKVGGVPSEFNYFTVSTHLCFAIRDANSDIAEIAIAEGSKDTVIEALFDDNISDTNRCGGVTL